MQNQTKFAKSGDVSIAYQLTGDAPLDLVYVPGWLSNVEYAWEFPRYAGFLNKLAGFSRLIRFDKRGTGMSDRNVGFPTLEQRLEDVRAVMDAAGSERAAIYASSEGGFMSMLFAATYPERTHSLILCGSFPIGHGTPEYPWRRSREEWERWIDDLERNWGGPFDLNEGAPSLAHDDHAREWFASYLRYSAGPSDAILFSRNMIDVDVRSILSTIQVRTLVLQARGDRWSNVENGRYLARCIPNAKLVELPSDDHIDWAADADLIASEIREFVTGTQAGPPTQRTLETVMITDIVESTATAARIGDEDWRSLLDQHDQILRRHVRQFNGNVINSTGDGLLLTFEGPTSAIHCGMAAARDLARLGITIRAGVHTGECEKRGDDLSGLAVHLAARVAAEARPDSIWVSRTVRDLTVGSGIEFVAERTAELKGIPGEWELLSVQKDA